MKFLVYPLLFTISTSVLGMHMVTKKIGKNNPLIIRRMAISKSDELDSMRKKWSINNSPQDIVDISQGTIVIKEEIPLGKRYGAGHNYAFTRLMGIVGKAPKILNILGQEDYYSEDYLEINTCFDLLEPNAALQPGDLIVYLSRDEKGEIADITHTGIVAGDDCIESKWGPIRAVFEHPIWYVPACFGDHCCYLRLKISGVELLAEIQKRLQQKQIKNRYDILAWHEQKELFDTIKQYEQDRSSINGNKIYTALEYAMNVHFDFPDENGITPLMHAERIGCETLKSLFKAYEMMNE